MKTQYKMRTNTKVITKTNLHQSELCKLLSVHAQYEKQLIYVSVLEIVSSTNCKLNQLHWVSVSVAYECRGSLALATTCNGIAFGIVTPNTSPISMSSGLSSPGSIQVKVWRSLASIICTIRRPKFIPGQIRRPDPNGNNWKSIPFVSNALPRNLSGLKSNGFS